ncbi:hypothetical protein [Azospirillum sp. B2RO_4]
MRPQAPIDEIGVEAFKIPSDRPEADATRCGITGFLAAAALAES